MTELRDAAMTSKAWPFEEARRLLKRYEKAPPEKGHVLFETGYGPSGLPHIGTFGEVLRTTMIRRAFEVISDIPTRLICFSDDMDGMRKVPGNVPNQEMLREHLQKPLTSVPDPFGTHESFGTTTTRCCAGSSTRSGSSTSSFRDRVLRLGPVRRDPAARRRAL
jgi:lysyl-tRNA synthetase class 1